MSEVRGCSHCHHAARVFVPLPRPWEPVPSPAARNKDLGNAAFKGLLQARAVVLGELLCGSSGWNASE